MADIYGYPVQSGYIGYVNGTKMLFSTEEEYKEFIFENEKEEN